MIAVDSSALIAIVLDEPDGPRCRRVLADERELLIAAPNLTEALIVAKGRRVEGELLELIDAVGLKTAPLDEAGAQRAADAYARWGRNFHSARLNYGDCFAYALAQERGCPLLFVGDDFAKTDVVAA